MGYEEWAGMRRSDFERIVNFEDWKERTGNNLSLICSVTDAAFLRQTNRYGSNG